jgi:hypothetical protein
MPFNVRQYHGQLVCGEAVVAAQRDWLEPELAHHTITPDVDVPWLLAIEAVEEEPVWARNPLDARHRFTVS